MGNVVMRYARVTGAIEIISSKDYECADLNDTIDKNPKRKPRFKLTFMPLTISNFE
eukprot:Pgem_evm1s6449